MKKTPKTKEEIHVLSIRLPSSIHAYLRKLSFDKDQSINLIIGSILKDYKKNKKMCWFDIKMWYHGITSIKQRSF